MDDERRNALTVAQMVRLLDCSEEVVVNDTRLRQCPPSLERRWALSLSGCAVIPLALAMGI